MILTNGKAEMLAKYPEEDVEWTDRLFQMPPEKATKQLNAEGLDFTVDELKEFAELLQKVATMNKSNGELDEEALSGVSGGILFSTMVVIVVAFCGLAYPISLNLMVNNEKMCNTSKMECIHKSRVSLKLFI